MSAEPCEAQIQTSPTPHDQEVEYEVFGKSAGIPCTNSAGPEVRAECITWEAGIMQHQELCPGFARVSNLAL